MKTTFTRPLTIAILLVFVGVLAVGYQYTNGSTIFSLNSQVAKSPSDADAPRIIGWDDLLPEGETISLPVNAASDFEDVLASPVPSHDSSTADNKEDPFSLVLASARQDLADQFVMLAGYMTPLDVEQGKTSSFLLVPYIGACIHVPAPPANQIVLVETSAPIEIRDMWEPFEAIGTLRVETVNTELADVSYKMDLERIEPYVYENN